MTLTSVLLFSVGRLRINNDIDITSIDYVKVIMCFGSLAVMSEKRLKPQNSNELPGSTKIIQDYTSQKS